MTVTEGRAEWKREKEEVIKREREIEEKKKIERKRAGKRTEKNIDYRATLSKKKRKKQTDNENVNLSFRYSLRLAILCDKARNMRTGKWKTMKM